VFPALSSSQIRLLPAPREAHFDGETPVPETVTVSVPGHDAEDEFAARDLEEALKQAAHAKAGAENSDFRIVLLRAGSAEGKALLARRKLAFDAPMQEEGYVLVIEPARLSSLPPQAREFSTGCRRSSRCFRSLTASRRCPRARCATGRR